MPIVALVGRPNVGKSTLFNRLVGRRLAIVEDEAGTTRDRLYATAEWAGASFLLVDTGGLDVAITDKAPQKGARPKALGASSADFATEVRLQAQAAIAEADLIVLVADAVDGPTASDRDVAELLRRSGRPVVLAVNKADNEARRQDSWAFYELNLGEPFPISALHGTGTGELLDAIVGQIPTVSEEGETPAIRVAIVGRPNVGKSSLLNTLLQEERAIVSSIPGTTRDAIDTELVWQGQRVTLIDTAGIRRRGRVDAGVEKHSVLRAVSAIQRSDVVLLVVDAMAGVTAQDAHVAGIVLDAYRSVAVLVNKWDALPDKDNNTTARYVALVRSRLRFMEYVPVLTISAKSGQRVSRILPLIADLDAQRRLRIPTGELNRLLRDAIAERPAFSRRGRTLKLLYATQAETAPPTFVLFVNDPTLVHFSYARYIENRIRAAHPFMGTPIRVHFRSRTSENDDSHSE